MKDNDQERAIATDVSRCHYKVKYQLTCLNQAQTLEDSVAQTQWDVPQSKPFNQKMGRH